MYLPDLLMMLVKYSNSVVIELHSEREIRIMQMRQQRETFKKMRGEASSMNTPESWK